MQYNNVAQWDGNCIKVESRVAAVRRRASCVFFYRVKFQLLTRKNCEIIYVNDFLSIFFIKLCVVEYKLGV